MMALNNFLQIITCAVVCVCVMLALEFVFRICTTGINVQENGHQTVSSC